MFAFLVEQLIADTKKKTAEWYVNVTETRDVRNTWHLLAYIYIKKSVPVTGPVWPVGGVEV
jgi:hypothetical protein